MFFDYVDVFVLKILRSTFMNKGNTCSILFTIIIDLIRIEFFSIPMNILLEFLSMHF